MPRERATMPPTRSMQRLVHTPSSCQRRGRANGSRGRNGPGCGGGPGDRRRLAIGAGATTAGNSAPLLSALLLQRCWQSTAQRDTIGDERNLMTPSGR